MAAMLATLEGNEKGITLNDLFDVNDYLGVNYFGPEDWNRVKKCACLITMKAAKNPVLFYIDSLKDDYKDYKPSQLANCVFGFNDAAGVELMGALPWERCKLKIDNELLGWPDIGGAIKSFGSGLKKAAGVAYDVATAPIKAGEYIIEKTPLKYAPGAKWYKTTTGLKKKYVDNPVKSAVQSATDASSGALWKLATKTPLKYTGLGVGTQLIEKLRESSGVTTPGTAEVYESQAEKDAKAAAAAAAAGRAAAAATAKQAEQLKAAKNLKAQKEQTAAAEAAAAASAAEQAATQTQLEQTQATLTSKYAPWVLGGCGLLLALSILKK
jgi:hypothetical protein